MDFASPNKISLMFRNGLRAPGTRMTPEFSLARTSVNVGEIMGTSTRVSPITSVASSPISQKSIATGSKNGLIVLYSTGATVMSRHDVSPPNRRAVNVVSFMEDDVLATTSSDGAINVWDCTRASSSIAKVLSLEARESISALTVARSYGNSAVLITGTGSGVLHIRDLRTSSGDGDKSSNPDLGGITAITEGVNGGFVFGTSRGELASQDIRFMRRDPIVRFSNVGPNVVKSKECFSKVTANIDPEIWDLAMGTRNKRPKQVAAVKKDDMYTNAKSSAHNGEIISIGFRSPSLLTTLGKDNKIKLFDCVQGAMLEENILTSSPICGAYSDNLGFVIGNQHNLQIRGQHRVSSEELNSHQGSVTAVCAVGHWGICSGGIDGNIFHSIFKS